MKILTENPKCLLITEVCERTRLSKPTIYKLMKTGCFPKQLRLSSQRVVWLANEIDTWLAERSTEREVQL